MRVANGALVSMASYVILGVGWVMFLIQVRRGRSMAKRLAAFYQDFELLAEIVRGDS